MLGNVNLEIMRKPRITLKSYIFYFVCPHLEVRGYLHLANWRWGEGEVSSSSWLANCGGGGRSTSSFLTGRVPPSSPDGRYPIWPIGDTLIQSRGTPFGWWGIPWGTLFGDWVGVPPLGTPCWDGWGTPPSGLDRGAPTLGSGLDGNAFLISTRWGYLLLGLDGGIPLSDWMGYPLQSGDKVAERALAIWCVVCLLRSCGRTFLFGQLKLAH